ncbi:MAG: response regulator [Candidatus Omnitrophica bacterium]|nr:response regulator [Candidatus Omnitrophota bacterium]
MAKLLVIEDEEEARTALSEALRKGGHNVSAFENGTSAVEEFKRRPVDLVFCDLRMSGLDGLSVLHALKGIDPWITVIVMTAYGTVESVARLFQNGAYDVLEKPFTLSQIQQLARRALDHRKKLKEIARLQGEPGIAPDVPARLRELDRLRADFLGMVMRDLKAPLQLIQEDLALIRQGYYGLRDGLRQQQLLSRLERISTLMRRTAEGALAVFLSQEQRLSIAPCDIQKNLEGTVQMVRMICSDKKIDFHATSPATSIIGLTEGEKIRFLAEELLLQAVEHGSAGDRILFALGLEAGGFCIDLKMTGQNVRNVWSDISDRTRPSLSRHYAELLGGRLEIPTGSKANPQIRIRIPWFLPA